ncbi:MAG: head-tail connector protein, partial [Niameybacter sp.]
MLERLKKVVRITHDKLDDEILDIIDVVKTDLRISGVKKVDDEDPLIYQAIKTYLKSEYETDTVKSEKLMFSYERLKEHLALCGE